MYGFSNALFPRVDYDQYENCQIQPSHEPTNTAPFVTDQLPWWETGSPSSVGGSTTTTSQGGLLNMQRSVSSHSLEVEGGGNSNIMSGRWFASPNFQELLELDSACSVRTVFSSSDLHNSCRAESPLSSESSMIIESMSRASKYSPEEKKERIERYRSKRTQRNFNKKIKYECRKTLADSRPRIRGRFARNDEIEKNPQLQWTNITGEEDEDENDAWINNFLNHSE